MHKPRRLLRSHLKEMMTRHRPERFQALRDVSFEVNHGESVAIIGRNGAGKSTLLGLVAGLVNADSGTIEVNGRGAALLQLGSGFHADLTGIENVHLNASVLGVSRQRTDELMDEIIEFSGIGDFVHEPVRSYSSGMVMRLAFSVAVCVDPDFLIIDEVLAVGDRAFQEKCVERIYQLHQAGKTILCVSHASATVRELCSRALWLEEGVLRMDGPIDEVIAAYEGGLNLRPVQVIEPEPGPVAGEETVPGPQEEPEPPVTEPEGVEDGPAEAPPEQPPSSEPPAVTEDSAEAVPFILETAPPIVEESESAGSGDSGQQELDLVPAETPSEEPAPPPVPAGPPCEEELAYIRELVLNHYCFVDYQNRTIMPRSTTAALIVPIDYESVVPREKSREPFAAITAMLEQRMWAFRTLCDRLQPHLNLVDVQFDLADPADEVSPFWNNTFFTGMDARAAYALVRSLTPARVVEIGSGNSTRFLRKAVRDGKLATRITCIDPAPRLAVHAVADEVRTESIISTPLDYFSSLQPGDILFFDGSHLCFHDSDVTHFFLRVLPAVPRGVLVHVHDIFLPEEYPEDFDIRYYNEQYMLAAFLYGNSNWKPLLPIHYLYGQGAINADGCSFWIVNGFVPDPELKRRPGKMR